LQKDTNSPIFFRALFLGIPGTFLIDFADYWGLLVSTSKNYILATFFQRDFPHFASKISSNLSVSHAAREGG
jgi:hypothetical protein